jgi:hypothetical protein
MSDAEAARLYTLLIAGPLIAVLVLAIVLSVLHVLALHGHRILPERPARVIGWLVFGLVIGLITQLLSTDLMSWAVAGALAAWILTWAWREGRLSDAGLALVGGALPWLVSVGLFMVLLRSDPTLAVVDVRFPIVVGALVVAGIGIGLMVAAPRTPPTRTLTPIRRAMLLPNAIDREQAMGPVPAPLVLAFVAGMTGTIIVLLLVRSLDPVPLQLIVGAVFIGLSLGTWWVATPRRVRDAQGVFTWLVDAERRMWAERLGRSLPRLPNSLRHLVDSLPDDAGVRPLKVEVLATFGRLPEAEAELARLPLETPEQRAVEAESAEYVGWYAGRPEEGAIDRLARELPSIDDAATRLRLRVSLAVARARRAAGRRDPAAIDHLLEVRPLLGKLGSRFREPGVIGVIAGFVLIGLLGFVLSPLLAILPDGVQ